MNGDRTPVCCVLSYLTTTQTVFNLANSGPVVICIPPCLSKVPASFCWRSFAALPYRCLVPPPAAAVRSQPATAGGSSLTVPGYVELEPLLPKVECNTVARSLQAHRQLGPRQQQRLHVRDGHTGQAACKGSRNEE